jgi:ribosome biogenesis GTPase
LTHDLAALGWTPELERALAELRSPQVIPARVAAQHRGRFVLFTASGEISAEASGRLRHEAPRAEFPAAGDWVAATPSGEMARIDHVLPRKSAFLRAATDLTRASAVAELEVVAANIDLVFIATAADRDLNPRRIERFLAAAFESGAEPVVLITKLDLAGDPEALLALVAAIAPGAPVLGLSNLTGEGVEAARSLIGPGRTAALLGSSGVGKSSLVNRLIGSERQAVSAIGPDQRGRHTTTARELILLPGGGLVLDTPGMRLITPADDAGLGAAFADIEDFARACRFKDCRHQGEPGCAVRAAVEAGALAKDRLAGHAKLRRELEHLERKDDKRAESEQRKRWRAVHKAGRERMREKRRGWD